MTLTNTCLPADPAIHDLRPFASEQRLIELVLTEVPNAIEASVKREGGNVVAPDSKLLLALLTYCYVVGVYGSEDIEWACHNDLGTRHLYDLEARHIRPKTFPDRGAIQRFRRAHAPLIEACLTRVLAAMVPSCLPPTADHRRVVPAREKLQLAIKMDTAVFDFD